MGRDRFASALGAALGAAVTAGMLLACAAAPSSPLPAGRVALRYVGFDGELRSLAERRGAPTLVLIVATWAGPALVELERIFSLRQARPGVFSLVVLALDEDPRMVGIFAETHGIEADVGVLPDQASFVGPGGPFGPVGQVPTSVLLDAEGRIAVRSDGLWPPGALERALDQLLAR